MTTKELTDYMESLGEILTSDDNLKAELREEIIKRLKEHDEMKKACLRAQEYEVRGK